MDQLRRLRVGSDVLATIMVDNSLTGTSDTWVVTQELVDNVKAQIDSLLREN
jgi:hypothetical protein